MKRKGVICLVTIMLLAGLFACHNQTDTPTVSFKYDIQPILNANCAIAGCHVSSNPTTKIVLDSIHAYTQLIAKGYVFAGQPNNSIMYLQMSRTTPMMPPTGYLGKSTTDKVYYWIQQGAANN